METGQEVICMNDDRFTVGDLQRQLRMLNPDDELQFDGGLTFSRIKRRGDDLPVMEFCEPQAYLDDSFRREIRIYRWHLSGLNPSKMDSLFRRSM